MGTRLRSAGRRVAADRSDNQRRVEAGTRFLLRRHRTATQLARRAMMKKLLKKGGNTMPAQPQLSSMQPQSRSVLPEVSWDQITEPGTYVEAGSGDLYRIPKEALVQGSSPVIRKESLGASRLLQLSNNPFITTFQARMLACEHNIQPNF